MYTVKTDQFEGPLEVLLKMIERNKLDITRFSLAEVAGEYLNYIEEKKQKEEVLRNLSQFLWVASGLALLKSKALLPDIEIGEGEEEDLEELERRVKEYRKFKQLGEAIKIKLLKEGEGFKKSKNKEADTETKSAPRSVFIEQNKLLNSYLRIKREFLETQEQLQEKKREEENFFSIEEKINQIKIFLEKTQRVSFLKTVNNSCDKVEIIVSFLSILELLKQKSVKLEQKELFAEIFIQKR
ncbi:MAG: segregation and condensation protein A [Patescibacteria group bacterium]